MVVLKIGTHFNFSLDFEFRHDQNSQMLSDVAQIPTLFAKMARIRSAITWPFIEIKSLFNNGNSMLDILRLY